MLPVLVTVCWVPPGAVESPNRHSTRWCLRWACSLRSRFHSIARIRLSEHMCKCSNHLMSHHTYSGCTAPKDNLQVLGSVKPPGGPDIGQVEGSRDFWCLFAVNYSHWNKNWILLCYRQPLWATGHKKRRTGNNLTGSTVTSDFKQWALT